MLSELRPPSIPKERSRSLATQHQLASQISGCQVECRREVSTPIARLFITLLSVTAGIAWIQRCIRALVSDITASCTMHGPLRWSADASNPCPTLPSFSNSPLHATRQGLVPDPEQEKKSKKGSSKAPSPSCRGGQDWNTWLSHASQLFRASPPGNSSWFCGPSEYSSAADVPRCSTPREPSVPLLTDGKHAGPRGPFGSVDVTFNLVLWLPPLYHTLAAACFLSPPLIILVVCRSCPRTLNLFLTCVCCCCSRACTLPCPGRTLSLYCLFPYRLLPLPFVLAVQQGCVVPNLASDFQFERPLPPIMASLKFIMDVNDDHHQPDNRLPHNKRDKGANKPASAGQVHEAPPSSPQANPRHATRPGLPAEKDINRAAPAPPQTKRRGPSSRGNKSAAATSGAEPSQQGAAAAAVPSPSSSSPSLSAPTSLESPRRRSSTSNDSMDPRGYGSGLPPSQMGGGPQRPMPLHPVVAHLPTPRITPKTGRISKAQKGLPVHVCTQCRPPKVRSSSPPVLLIHDVLTSPQQTFTRAEHLR